jgi:adenylylsulfate kinase
VDGTSYRRDHQARVLPLADTYVARLTADLQTCLARTRRRSDSISEQDVHVVHREFREPPSDVVVDTEATSVEATVDRLLDAAERWTPLCRSRRRS